MAPALRMTRYSKRRYQFFHYSHRLVEEMEKKHFVTEVQWNSGLRDVRVPRSSMATGCVGRDKGTKVRQRIVESERHQESCWGDIRVLRNAVFTEEVEVLMYLFAVESF